MKLGLLILLLTLNLLIPSPSLAQDSAVLISPADQSSVTSTTLTWQSPSYSVYSSNPYRVQVDSNSQFDSPDKDYTTDNTSYTPTLSLGTWFWRVKIKDSSGVFSDWSNAWSFSLVSGIPTPSPTPSSTPTSSPTSTPQPTSSAQLAPTPQFTLSSLPTQINSSQSFVVNINLALPNNANQTFYLKAAFVKASGGSNYFGLTKVSGNWIKNSAGYSSQQPVQTDTSGNYAGPLEIMPDISDSGFIGSGDYIFKVGRYNSSGDLVWSDNYFIYISYQPTPSPSQTSKPTPSATPIPNTKYDIPHTLSPSDLALATTNTGLDLGVPNLASIEGIASLSSLITTPSATIRNVGQAISELWPDKSPTQSWPVWITVLGGAILTLGGLLIITKNAIIKQWFTKLLAKMKQLNWPESWPRI